MSDRNPEYVTFKDLNAELSRYIRVPDEFAKLSPEMKVGIVAVLAILIKALT